MNRGSLWIKQTLQSLKKVAKEGVNSLTLRTIQKQIARATSKVITRKMAKGTGVLSRCGWYVEDYHALENLQKTLFPMLCISTGNSGSEIYIIPLGKSLKVLQ